jgi:hypothetical protein
MIQWSLLNVIIQGIAGFAGAHAAATAVHDHKFGFIGHSLAGMAAGLLSGCFLQVTAMTVVTGSGSENLVSMPETIAIQLLCGAGVGAIAMIAVGILKKGWP